MIADLLAVLAKLLAAILAALAVVPMHAKVTPTPPKPSFVAPKLATPVHSTVAAPTPTPVPAGPTPTPSAPTSPTVWRDCAPVTWSVQGGVPDQHTIVAAAVDQVAAASGQRYTQVGDDDPTAALTIIIWPDRSVSRYLTIDGTADYGYTRWWPNARAGIDLLINAVSTPLVLHELMLSRHLTEGPDPGGLLGHVVPRLRTYPAQDVAMLAASACL